MTGMPELIAMLHSFVGLAAVLVGWNSSYETRPTRTIHDVEVFVGVFIGAVTFTGSIVAYLKLSAKMKSAPLMLPGTRGQPRHHRRFVVMTVVYVLVPHDNDVPAAVLLGIMTLLALFLGWHLVLDRRRRHAGRRVDAQQLLRLGGGRGGLPAQQRPAHHHRRARRLLRCLPVLHHVQGDEPLVHLGHRGRLRCRGGAVSEDKDYGEHREITAVGVAELLKTRARSSSRRVTAWPRRRRSMPSPTSPASCGPGVDVRFGIHPVAGRLPGT
jgi:NAD(P) transhydrogenase subunit beta